MLTKVICPYCKKFIGCFSGEGDIVCSRCGAGIKFTVTMFGVLMCAEPKNKFSPTIEANEMYLIGDHEIVHVKNVESG